MQCGNALFARVYHQVIVRAPERLPRTGPAILVCNHTSGLDPMLVQSALRRLVVWMMAKEYYEIHPLTMIFKAVEAIPVDRGGRDMTATRAALRALADGRILGIFPEGKIEPTRDLLPFQSGVALMAIKSKVPVYPVYLDGSQRGKEMAEAYLFRNQVVLAFGPEVQFERASTSREALDAATRSIEEAVRALKDQYSIGKPQ
jgi:1-acyl-sn-glycerol-3-phosphate acyltransferase